MEDTNTVLPIYSIIGILFKFILLIYYIYSLYSVMAPIQFTNKMGSIVFLILALLLSLILGSFYGEPVSPVMSPPFTQILPGVIN